MASFTKQSCLLGDRREAPGCGKYKAMLFGGALVYAGGVVFDWVTSAESARRVNRRREHLRIMPTVVTGPGSTSAGIGLSGAF